MTILRSTLAYILMLSNAVLSAGWMCLTARKAPLARRLLLQRRMAGRNRAILATVCGLRCRVEGAENLPPAPFVIFSLHQSAFETLIFPAFLPPFVWVLKKSLVGVPLLGPALARLEPVAIDRGDARVALRQVLEQGAAKLDQGIGVLIFPEGTRYPPGRPGAFRSSAAALASGAGVPIVPVVHDTGRFWAAHGFAIRPGCVTVRIGPPLPPAEMTDLSAKEITTRLRRETESMLAEMDDFV